MRLAFSIPVHEKTDVVRDLVRNVFHYNPGSAVVLHVSQLFAEFDEAVWKDEPDVVINPQRYTTQHGKGLMLCHCSNFYCLQENGIDFDAFCLISSNEMFIRPGLCDYIKNARNGFQAICFDLASDWHVFRRRVDRHPKIIALLSNLGATDLFGGQAEGQFFERDVFNEIYKSYMSAFGNDPISDFETEEVVPQTVAIALGIRPSPPFTLVDYSHSVDFKITEQVVKLLASPLLAGRIAIDLGEKAPLVLESPHQHEDNRSVFSVKRVPRDLNEPLRMFINSLPTLGRCLIDSEGRSPGFDSDARPIPLIPDLMKLQEMRRPSWVRKLRMRLGLRTRAHGILSKLRQLLSR